MCSSDLKISISGDRNVLLLFPLNFPTSVVQAQTEGKIHTSIDIIINTVSTSIFSQYNQLTRQELELLSKEIIKRFPGLADYYEQESYVSSPSFFILLIISYITFLLISILSNLFLSFQYYRPLFI